MSAPSARYDFERRLADRLRATPREQRPAAYAETYDTLYTFLRNAGELHPERPRGDLPYSLAVMRSLVASSCTILEVGSGTGHLALALAALGYAVVATELSEVPLAVLRERTAGTGVRVTQTNALTLDIPGTFDVAWSNDLLEHLHPEDVPTHLRAVLRRLNTAGRYIVVTPNRYAGPFDISRGFSRVATGLHLKEWTHRELARELRDAGFTRIETVAPHSHLRWKIARRLGSHAGVRLAAGGTGVKRVVEPALAIPGLRLVASALGATPVTLIAYR